MVMAALLVACVGLYAGTVNYPMQFDSVMYLRNNPMLRAASSFPYPSDLLEFFRQPLAAGVDPDLATNIVTRPLAYATFHLNWRMDGYNPFWYRVINIGIHTINSLLVFALAWTMARRRPSQLYVAGVAAFLFAVHPLATESVTYIVQRLTSLATMFYLLAVWLHLRAADITSRDRRRVVRGVSVLIMLMAMLSKESAVTAPVMAVLLDRVRTGASWRQVLTRAIPLLCCLPVVPALVFAAAWGLNYGELTLKNVLNISASKDVPITHWNYAVTQTVVVLRYLRLLVWPSGMNIDPDVEGYSSLIAWPVLGALSVFGAIIGGAWYLHRRQLLGFRSSMVMIFTIWFFATVVVSSGLVPLPDYMAEHRTYLPSVGIFIGLAFLLDALRARLTAVPGGVLALHAVTVLALIGLSVTTLVRNRVWSSEIAMWEDAAAKSPGKYRVWGNLGVAYAFVGRLEDSVRCGVEATRIEPRFANGAMMLASVLNAMDRFQEAFAETERIHRVNPTVQFMPDYHYNRGVALAGIGRVDEGRQVLADNLKSWPSHWQSHCALGLIARSQKKWPEAVAHFRDALAVNPGHAPIQAVLSQTMAESGIAGP